ncbi:replication-relaxation family protein [Bacillus sp. MUM 13]|uniref:replication-relaxation family protein n=1 Tax=Bacillus sp. MUM 13 TaxID=1678001 RepID=UPI0008F5C42A|nr:replication-relaxation family protein [Bacillus sp. MUM 13]OIK06464.1 hypothetical protein BIV59_21470 [Bacillus sp. MUM 13]
MRKRYYIKNGKGLEGVYLDNEDLRILKFIWNQRLLTTRQIASYYHELKGITQKGVANKLRSWAKYNVLVANEYVIRKQFGIHFKYYRIGKFGFEILKEEGLIQSKENVELDYKWFTNSIKNIEHFFATQEVVTQLHCYLLHTTFDSVFPLRNPHENALAENQLVLPDWVVSKENTIVNIETDSGREQLTVIENKIKNYEFIAKKHPENTYHILFSVIDDSFKSLMYQENREKRVAGIKNQMLTRPFLRIENLYIHVVPLKSAGLVAANILNGDAPLISEKRQEIVEDNMNFVWNTIFDDFHFKITACDDDIYPSNLESNYYADKCVWFQDKINKERKFRVLVVVMEEGSFKAFDRLHRLDQFNNGPNQFKCQIEFILVMYRTDEELQRDVLGRKFEKMLFGSLEGWLEQESESPIFYYTKSSYRKEVTELV